MYDFKILFTYSGSFFSVSMQLEGPITFDPWKAIREFFFYYHCINAENSELTKRNEITYFGFLADKPQNATVPFLAKALGDACKQGLL